VNIILISMTDYKVLYDQKCLEYDQLKEELDDFQGIIVIEWHRDKPHSGAGNGRANQNNGEVAC
jgi:hypothetical protein